MPIMKTATRAGKPQKRAGYAEMRIAGSAKSTIVAMVTKTLKRYSAS